MPAPQAGPKARPGPTGAIDPDMPYWRDYRALLRALDLEPFPGPEQLNRLLPPGVVTGSGHPVRFSDPARLAPRGYEERIAATGLVATRANDWHDLFNALVWCRFPHTKAALNTRHMEGMGHTAGGRRGRLRDALTLFDECGVVVLSLSEALLDALSERAWHRAFLDCRQDWASRTAVMIVGHALLEKFLDPYKAMTAHALLVRADANFLRQPGPEPCPATDAALADRIVTGAWLRRPGDLSPLPLAGIPGWWAADPQDAGLYADARVFRPPHTGIRPAPVFRLS